MNPSPCISEWPDVAERYRRINARIYTRLADSDAVIDDALNRFENVFKLVCPTLYDQHRTGQ